jgi:predicted metal-dependent peptidase
MSINEDALEALTTARVSLLLKKPFFGVLALNLKLVEVDQTTAEKMTTAAVDGKHLWYNPAYINTLTKEELQFVVAHEILHCVYNHFGRRYDRNPKIYNVASDLVINAILMNDGMTKTKRGVFDENYLNWTTEDVYDDLIKKGDGDGKGGAGSEETMDYHPGDEGYPGGDADSEDGDGLSDEEREKIANDWRDNVIQAAQVAAGNIPAGLQRFIQNLTDPKMDWKQMLQMHLQSCVRTDYTWMRPNKRTFGQGITLPSMDLDDMIEICVAIDTSGSVSPDMLSDFLSEIKGVMDAFSQYKIHIACFDTSVHNPQTFECEDDLMEYDLQGFGGTDFMAWWNFAKKQPWIGDVRKCIFFTDGYPYGEWGIDGLVDTLWVVHGGENEGPFGTTVYYDDHSKD